MSRGGGRGEQPIHISGPLHFWPPPPASASTDEQQIEFYWLDSRPSLCYLPSPHPPSHRLHFISISPDLRPASSCIHNKLISDYHCIIKWLNSRSFVQASEKGETNRQTDGQSRRKTRRREQMAAQRVVGGAAGGTWPEAGLWEPVGARERPTEVLMKRIKI